jgi:hypothetical protein
VALAEQTDSDDRSPDRAEQLLRRAEQAVIEVKQLLPVLTEDQHRSIGMQLEQLQEALEHIGHAALVGKAQAVLRDGYGLHDGRSRLLRRILQRGVD